MKNPSAPLVTLRILATSSVPLLGMAAVLRTTSSASSSIGSPSIISSALMRRFFVFGISTI